MTEPSWDPERREWATEARAGAIALQGVKGALTADRAALEELGQDFGKIVRATPGAILRAASAHDVATALRFCSDHGVPVVARAFGQSGHGQAQGAGALVIDLRGLDSIEGVSPSGVTVGAAVTWRRLLAEVVPRGLTFPVFTNHVSVSVGGSTSIGGTGAASHRYGFQADNVAAIEVATTAGEVLTCSPTANAELFYAALGGLGQFGFITKLTLRTILAPKRVAMLRLAYDDLRPMLADTFRFGKENRFDIVDNRVGVQPEGGPLLAYNDVTLFLYGDEAAPDLRPLARSEHGRFERQEEHDYATYIQRDDAYVHVVAEVLAHLTKPWCAYVLAEADVEDFVMTHMRPLLHAQAGAFAFLLQPYPARLARSTTFPLPAAAAEWFGLVGIVRALPEAQLEQALREHRTLFERVLELRGSIYPYGSVPLRAADWPKLHRERWASYAELKKKYDPRGVLNPGYQIDAGASELRKGGSARPG